MSIEETIVLGQVPGTDYQPTYVFWFTLASGVLILWLLYEVYKRVHVNSTAQTQPHRATVLEHPFIGYGTLSLHTPTISNDEPYMPSTDSGFRRWVNTFRIQLQFLEQKTFLFVRFAVRKFTETVHILAQSALFTTVKQRVVAVRLPSRTLIVTQAKRIVARLEQWEQVCETFIVKTARQAWRELHRISSAHDWE